MPARYRLTDAAAADVERVLRHTAATFGPAQRDRYAALLERAAEALADNPRRPGALARPDLPGGLFSFRLDRVAGRRGAAAHVLYYRVLETDEATVLIVRVLHEHMEPGRHVGGLMAEDAD